MVPIDFAGRHLDKLRTKKLQSGHKRAARRFCAKSRKIREYSEVPPRVPSPDFPALTLQSTSQGSIQSLTEDSLSKNSPAAQEKKKDVGTVAVVTLESPLSSLLSSCPKSSLIST